MTINFIPLADPAPVNAELSRNKLIASYQTAYAQAVANREHTAARVLRYRLHWLQRGATAWRFRPQRAAVTAE